MSTSQRVVVTGMGVVAPNGVGLKDYEAALRGGVSGIRFIDKLAELKFSCRVAGVPPNMDTHAKRLFSAEELMAMNSDMLNACVAGLECWEDAGFIRPSDGEDAEVDWNTGAIVGTGIGGLDTIGETLVPKTNAGKVRRLGSTMVEQIMSSSVSAKLTGFLALGGQVTTNSSACTTGTEAVVNGYRAIKDGYIDRVVAGGSEGSSHYIWAGFDAMRVLTRSSNDAPEKASRPMSASASGFVPAAGAGLLMLESLESAQARGANIHAEVLGGHVNCGGQRGGGSMTAPNPEGVRRCVRAAIKDASIKPSQVDLINGHLTATMADVLEVTNWSHALERGPGDFPLVNSTKSMVGHALGGAGGLELVASVLQLSKGFVHPSLNCEDLHPKLVEYDAKIPRETIEKTHDILAKASFGFGDVNGCVILRRWS